MPYEEKEKINLKDYTLAGLIDFFTGLGEPAFKARQVAEWLFKKGVATFDGMTNISLPLRTRLEDKATTGGLTVISKQISRREGTVKYLFGLRDGHAVETVLMRHAYGRSVCLSNQVGCRMGCRLCASAMGGMVRNLSPGEMYDQVLTVQRDTGERVSHLVLMGTGEPLDNFANTIKFITNVTASYGLNISIRHITLSTCGLVPGIKELADLELAITLAVSLHAPDDQLRNYLMPVNKVYPLAELLCACRYYIEKTGRRITFEYALLSGVNDTGEHARELARLLRGMLCHVNLIPYNPVEEREFKRTRPDQVRRFKEILERCGVGATVRRELGSDIDAACGQLRRKRITLRL